MKTTKRIVVLTLLILLAGAVPGGVWAQEAQPSGSARVQAGGDVTYDKPVEGVIDDQAFSQSWTLQTVSADRIAVHVERLDGNLIPDVAIFDASGQSLDRSYGADDTGAVALIDSVTLPSAGAYQIVVGRDRGESGVTSGTYRLSVIPLGLGEDHPNNTDPVGPIELDGWVTGEITAQHWRHVYTLDAQAGDVVQVTARRLSGTLTPKLDILDANGTSLRTGYSNTAGDLAQIDRIELPMAGQYRVVIFRDRGLDGGTVGQYGLGVTLLGAGENSARLQNLTPGAIDGYDVPIQGEITNAQWVQPWQFTAAAADTITITVRRVPQAPPAAEEGEDHGLIAFETRECAVCLSASPPNNLRPYVELLGAAGQQLRQAYPDDMTAQAIIEHYTLQAPGTYTIRVLRERGQDGETTGLYELVITLDGAGEGSPTLAPVSGAVQVGTPVEGEISAERWADTWTFSGQADQEITVTVRRTGGTLFPRIDLQDMNGQSLRSAYPEETKDMATLQYRLPSTSEYRIVVFREQEQEGYTTGTYSLQVDVVAAQ